MEWKSFRNNIVSNFVTAGLLGGGGILLTLIRHAHPELATLILYGLAGAALIGVLLYVSRGRPLFSLRERVTSKNIEGCVKAWAEALGIGMTNPDQKLPDVFFGLQITLKNGNPVAVMRLKLKPQNLQMQSHLIFSPEHQVAIAKLPVSTIDNLVNMLHFELSRAKIVHTIAIPVAAGGIKVPQSTIITISNAVPINDDLNSSKFAECLDEIDYGFGLVRSTVEMFLIEGSQLSLKG
jgi:hypothetical protein